MPLPRTEAYVFDYIKSNQSIREFWDRRIAELRNQGLDDFDTADRLEEILIAVYMSSAEAMDDLIGLIDQIDLMTMDWKRLALMLVGRDVDAEIRAEYSQQKPMLFRRPFLGSPRFSPEKENEIYMRRQAVFQAKVDAYNADVKRTNTAQKWVAVICPLFGVGVVGLMWLQAPWELTKHAILISVGGIFGIAFLLWLLLASCVEKMRPRRKPDLLDLLFSSGS